VEAFVQNLDAISSCTPRGFNSKTTIADHLLRRDFMRRCRFTRTTPLIAGLIVSLLFAIVAVPLGAQPAHQPHPYYDVTKEVTLKGTVTEVLARPSAGMIAGSHLLLATESGAVDASLGKWGLQGKGALSVATGTQVEVTGVMKTLKDKQIFVARTVAVGRQVYTLRNRHGVAVSPQSRQRSAQKSAEKGESL
jgi:hypothetical protein